MREIPKELQVYRHFKGSLYQIVAIAVHTETTDKLVVYRSLQNPERVFARPLEMFLSEVNHKKYPEVKAKYRFTLLSEAEEEDNSETSTENNLEPAEIREGSASENNIESVVEEKAESEAKMEEPAEEKTEPESDDNAVYKEDGTLVLDPTIEKILDSKEYTDKIEAFELLRGKCDENMLSTIAMSLDIQLSGETLEEKYADILKCLRMHQKYETNRLR